MTDIEEQTTSGVRWLTDEEAHAIFDAEARGVMGMSGEEFSVAMTRASSTTCRMIRSTWTS